LADTTSTPDLMRRALALGAGVRRRTPPNPWVGCVLTRDGLIVGEGASEPPGGAHAEIVALAAAGDRARGATAHVTLEPCSHHGRTGPCADALLGAGVARVVVAIEDPDADVRGAGIERLRAGGVDVEVGPGCSEARRSLAAYLHQRRTGRAACLVKTATSLDGRVAAADGTSQWITGAAARADAHELRADSQAVVVGAGTAIADRPALTVRDAAEPVVRPPLRVLLDARGRVPAEGPLFDPDLAPTLVLTTAGAPPATLDAWRAAGAKVELLDPAPDGIGVDLTAALALLGRDGVLQAMVEGGPTLHGALLRAGLIDRVVAYVAGAVLGATGRPAFAGDGPATLADAPHLELLGARVLGDDVRLEYAPAGLEAAGD
jgi:diaminohydroxyphosphoribosylaminopyrimidine deaminase/5-amino-6-(5-phosphoribosylamino)uracil reductase